MKIKSIRVKQGMNLGFKVPVKIFENEKLRKEHNRFFGNFDEYDLTAKTQKIGDMINLIFDDGVTDENLNVIKYFVNRLMRKDYLTTDKIELANVFLSTAVKKVKAEDIKDGRVSPGLIRALIDTSIRNYYRNKIGKELDYRHIAGRMLNLKKLSEDFLRPSTVYEKKFAPIRWDEDKQADLLGILERIMLFYDSSKESFKRSMGFLRSQKGDMVSTYDMHQTHFYENIPELLALTCAKVVHLMQEPKKNFNEIMDKLDIAYFYYDKVPYDSHLMPRLMRVFSLLREKEKTLAEIMHPKKKNKKHL